jgi:hypothetical protein
MSKTICYEDGSPLEIHKGSNSCSIKDTCVLRQEDICGKTYLCSFYSSKVNKYEYSN